MVRVRLEGLPDEVQRIADAMQAAGCVLERSREYPNRGGSGYVTVYQTAFGRARTLPLTRSGVPPETPQPYSFAASLMRCGPSAQAPNEGACPLKLPRST